MTEATAAPASPTAPDFDYLEPDTEEVQSQRELGAETVDALSPRTITRIFKELRKILLSPATRGVTLATSSLVSGARERITTEGYSHVIDRDQIGMRDELLPIVTRVDRAWFSDRRKVEEYLLQQLTAAGLSAGIAVALLSAFSGKTDGEPLQLPKLKPTRRFFLKGVGTVMLGAGFGTWSTGFFPDIVISEVAKKMNMRGSSEIKKNPATAFVRFVGKMLERLHATHKLETPTIEWSLAKERKVGECIVKQIPLTFATKSLYYPAKMIVTEPINCEAMKLEILQASQLQPDMACASPEEALRQNPDSEITMSCIWGWPLEHADAVLVEGVEDQNLSAKYGFALPAVTREIVQDPVALKVMRKLAAGDKNPYYGKDLSLRAPDVAKFQQVVTYSPNGTIAFVPLKDFEQIVKEVRQNKITWGLQCHLTFNSEDVTTPADREKLRTLLDNMEFSEVSTNGCLYNPDTNEYCFINTPLTVPLNALQIFELAEAVAKHKGWKKFLFFEGDQGGATGTFVKDAQGGVYAGVTGFVYDVERPMNSAGELERVPVNCSHTHAAVLTAVRQ